MRLKGSCQCGKVEFTVESDTPYPYMFCYCSICRKMTGGGFGCNIMGRRKTLRVRGKPYLKMVHARVREPRRRTTISEAERWFCKECGTHLYVLDDRWPEGVWPNAGAIDTPLPVPPEREHIMLRYKPAWVEVVGAGARHQRYPELSIEDWHKQKKLVGAGKRKRTRRSG